MMHKIRVCSGRAFMQTCERIAAQALKKQLPLQVHLGRDLVRLTIWGFNRST